jgi:hypothetical protein
MKGEAVALWPRSFPIGETKMTDEESETQSEYEQAKRAARQTVIDYFEPSPSGPNPGIDQLTSAIWTLGDELLAWAKDHP